MNWEALTAISTAFTGLVILLTVVFAARQVKAMNEQSKALSAQLEHLRRATQLDGTLAIFEELMAPELLAASRFVLTEYEERMNDPQFHAEALGRSPDPETHQQVKVLRHFERIATLIKNDLLDADVLLDFANAFILDHWIVLAPLVREQRTTFGLNGLWENFEFISREAARSLPGTRLAALANADGSPPVSAVSSDKAAQQ